VTEFASLFEIAASAAVIVVPVIALNRLLADPDGPGLSVLFRIPVDPPMPRGVQEEEPLRWRLERLDRRNKPVGASTEVVGDGGSRHRPSSIRPRYMEGS
jgi:hypothetical protein